MDVWDSNLYYEMLDAECKRAQNRMISAIVKPMAEMMF